jgi:hypothetical protein
MIAFLLAAQTCFAALNAGDFPTFRACVEKAIEQNESEIFVPRMKTSAFVLREPLPAWPNGRLIIRGEGETSIIWLEDQGSICIPGCVLKLRDLRIYGNPAKPPKVGVCFCRPEEGPRKGQSTNMCQIRDCIINGSYSCAAVLVLCAEHSCIMSSGINNDCGDGLVYDSNDRYGFGRVTDTGMFTNTMHSLIDCGIAVWNKSGKDVFPLKICGFTDSLVAQSCYITAQKCRAYVAVESYPTSYNRGNVPRWNTLETCGWETRAGVEPVYGILYRRLGGQMAYPETLKKVPAIRWQTGPASGQETVP